MNHFVCAFADPPRKKLQEEQRVFCAQGSVGDADAEAHTR